MGWRWRATLLAAALVASPSIALASGRAQIAGCTCGDPPTPRQVLRDAEAALVGEVVGARPVPDGTVQRIRVDEVYAGVLPPEIEVHTRLGSGIVDPCAVAFGQGSPVALVLRRDEEGRWTQDRCALLSVDVLRRIGGPPRTPGPALATEAPASGAPPTPSTPVDEPRGAPWWLIALAGGGLGAAAIGGSLLLDRRRAAREDAGEPAEDDVGAAPRLDPRGPRPSR